MNTIRIPAGRSLDPYFHLHRDPTCFVLEAGEYTTQGAWGFGGNLDVCMVPAGSILRGAGSNQTMIRFTQPTTPAGTGYFEALTGGSRSGSSTSLLMEGFTIDVSASPMPVVALHLWSDAPTVHDVIVTGVWGDRTPRPAGTPSEGFGILLNRAGESHRDGDGLVDACQVLAPPHPLDPTRENYTTAIYLGIAQRPTVPCVNSRIVGCRVRGQAPASVHAAFGANDFTEVTDSASDGSFHRAWYADTGGAEGIRVTRCDFESAYAAFDLKSGQSDWSWRKVSLQDCEFTLNGSPTSDHVVALVLDDLTAPRPQAGRVVEFRSIRMKQCRLVNRSNARGIVAGLSAARTTDCGLSDCQLIGRWDPPIRCLGVDPNAFATGAPLL